MTIRQQRTFCRICEAHCGLIVQTDATNNIVGVRPDREHPVSQGFSCVKGLTLAGLHHDPDRVNYPQKKVDGAWQRISWEQALREIGARLRQLRRQHGPRSLGLYVGNPAYFSVAHTLYATAFLDAWGSPNHFASHSIDVNPKFYVATKMFGRSLIHPIPDLAHTQFFMCLGSNPTITQASVIQLPHPTRMLKAIEDRGGRVIIVDPRRTETARLVGEHVAIRPGTDAYFLLGMLHVLVHENGLDPAPYRPVADGIDAFCAAAAAWTPERAGAISDIPAARIRELANAFQAADGASLYMSTGVNMGPFGSLAYWLLQGLNLITGNLDRRGGAVFPPGAFDAVKLAQLVGLGGEDEERTLVAGWRRVAGAFPVAALAEEIQTDDPRRVRALIVSAGNPAHSVPGRRLAAALGELELLVCIDIYPSETAQYADYLLPAADMLERVDFPAPWTNLQVTPHAQYTPALVPPRFERRPEWQIYSDLARAAGIGPIGKTLVNLPAWLNHWLRRWPRLQITPARVLALLFRWGGQVTLKQLLANPAGIMLPATPTGRFLGHAPTANGRLQLAIPELLADLERLAAANFQPRPGQLQLIGRRQRRSHNSWLHNNRALNQPEQGPTALMHPADAAERGIQDRDCVRVTGPDGWLEIPARLTGDIRRGVIAVPHGWGHQASGLRRARQLAGSNVNQILPAGAIEPVSGQAIMSGHWVTVTPA